MPRYFFHIWNDVEVSDDEGLELQNIEAAKAYAVKAGRALMCENLQEQGRITLHHRIDIEDESGTVKASVTFGDAVEILP